MKHIFIVNPNAGQGRAVETIRSQLSALGSDIESEIYLTKGKGDAKAYIEHRLSESNTPIRFYACGGDGTVNEVINGIAPFSHSEFSVFPCGSGNDFVKCFGQGEAFLDIKSLVYGKTHDIDIIKVNDRYCINVCNFGLDANVVRIMEKVKNKFFLGGKNAYLTGVAVSFITSMCNRATVFADGKKLNNGRFLLCTIANGQYVGGQFKCAPRARVNDGWLDICLVDTVSRFTFLRLVKSYAEGRHLDDVRFKNIIRYARCKRVEIVADENFIISLDGELINSPHTIVEVVPNAARIAVPQKISEKYFYDPNLNGEEISGYHNEQSFIK